MTNTTNSPRMNTRRELLLILGSLVALVLTALWGYGRLNAAHARSVDDGEAWVQSTNLAGQIQALRDQPTLADDHSLQETDMTMRIARAVVAASLDEKRLIAIEHQAPRRIGRTNYIEEPTRLTFRDVTLRQVLTALDTLTKNDPRLHVSRLRLVAPRQDADSKRWTVDTTVTYLLYEPAQ